MDNLIKEVILGKDHQAQSEVYGGSFESQYIAWGTSVGATTKPNEDALGVSVLGAEVVLAVADGHWGRDASEIAVSKAVELLNPNARPSKDSETRARLFALFDQVNTELYELATSSPGASASETTLIYHRCVCLTRYVWLLYNTRSDKNEQLFMSVVITGIAKQPAESRHI